METTIRTPRRRRLLRCAPKFAACMCLMAVASLALAPSAFAWGLPDIGKMIAETVVDILSSAANGLLQFYLDCVTASGAHSFLSGSFEALFGSNWGPDGSSVWSIIETVHSTLLVPLGESILALVMLVQVVKISQRIDATATLPAVKEILFLAVTYVLLHWLIIDSTDILAAAYDEFNKITTAIFNSIAPEVKTILVPDFQDNVGAAFILVVISLIMCLAALVGNVIAWAICAMRAIQLYIYAAFSPIPLSLLGFEETRSMGVNFLKNFCALCLAGAVLAFILTIYPLICTNVVAQTGDILTGSGSSIEFQPSAIAALIGLPILFILSLTKSGEAARDVFGG